MSFDFSRLKGVVEARNNNIKEKFDIVKEFESDVDKILYNSHYTDEEIHAFDYVRESPLDKIIKVALEVTYKSNYTEEVRYIKLAVNGIIDFTPQEVDLDLLLDVLPNVLIHLTGYLEGLN